MRIWKKILSEGSAKGRLKGEGEDTEEKKPQAHQS